MSNKIIWDITTAETQDEISAALHLGYEPFSVIREKQSTIMYFKKTIIVREPSSTPPEADL